MRVLLTGATGFIGTSVMDRLLEQGDIVRALVRPESLAKLEKGQHLRQRPNLELLVGSLEDAQSLQQAVDNVEVVYHLAMTYPEGDRHGRNLIASNLMGANYLLRASVNADVRRVVFVSSVAVYGWLQAAFAWPLSEDAPLLGRGNYAATKIQIENLVHQIGEEHGLEHTILRLASVYGVNSKIHSTAIRMMLHHPLRYLGHPRKLNPVLEQGKLPLRWGGSPSESMISQWLHVRDAADAVVLAGVRPRVGSETFNIAGGEAVTRSELVALLHEADGDDWPSPICIPDSFAATEAGLVYDIRKAQAVLGFTPRVTLKEGLAEIIEAQNHSSSAPSRSSSRTRRVR